MFMLKSTHNRIVAGLREELAQARSALLGKEDAYAWLSAKYDEAADAANKWWSRVHRDAASAKARRATKAGTRPATKKGAV